MMDFKHYQLTEADLTAIGEAQAHRKAYQLSSTAQHALPATSRQAAPVLVRERAKNVTFTLKPVPSVTCTTCQDAGWLMRDKQLIPCRSCGHEREKARLLSFWPLPAKVERLQNKRLRPLDYPGMAKLITCCKQLTINWPSGVLVVLAGISSPAYGTGKTHALARIFSAAWESGKIALYTTGPELEERFTNFQRYRTNEDGQREWLEDESIYSQSLKDLRRADILLIDEADRMKKSGWAERHLFKIVNASLSNDNIVVMATNSLQNLPPPIQDRAYDTEEGAIIIDLSEVPSYRRLFAHQEPSWMKGYPK